MIIKILFKYILGYIRVSIEGYYVERFINICTNNKILIWNIKKVKGVKLYFNAGINDFKQLIIIAKKTKCKIKIERKRGIPFLLNKYRKRKIFLILFLIVCFSIYISSTYIWNIEIIIEEEQKIENIEQDIKNAGLIIGKRKSELNTKDIINEIRLNRNDISWIGIELDGTNAIVKIVKSEKAPEIINENDYCNIVAIKSGVISKIIAQNGTVRVKEGDIVREGDILIEGVMEGKYTGVRNVHSLGSVSAKVWYTENTKIYYNQQEKKETGKLENKYSIKFNNFKINFYKTLSNFEIYDTIETENKLKLFSNLYLPISIIKNTNKEQEVLQKTYTIEEAKQLGIKQLQEKLENQIEQKENILR